ncbi:MAG TPA: type II toxin-antitoxin system PemK/MazF family toxin [Burkholderiaceae bacterium]|nr:type II toxin-antitoxin system PemK/MazF family toxin [Burkholderiaceae bacterium]
MAGKFPKRGEIWLVDLNPTKGREQAGTRPVLVLSPADETLAIVLPISQGITLARSQGFAVSLMGTGLTTQGVVICNQPRTVALRERNGKKIETAPADVMLEVLARIAPLVT